jgi:small subunit ribosomal protein S17
MAELKKTEEKHGSKSSEQTKETKAPQVKENGCKDLNCPTHGRVSLRGRTFEGIVLKNIFQKTATVEWERRNFVKKYERYEKRRTRVKAHCPQCLNISKGDKVKIMESRPISKTKKFIIIQKISGN